MSLANLIRKGATGKPANANPANSANDGQGKGQTLARLATLALANPPEVKAEPIKLTGGDEFIIRRWLAHIEETDPALIENCLNQCRTDPEALAYFLQRAREVPEDDRRYCRQCGNLTAANKCRASKVSPITDLPQRCEDYSPGPEDLDRRSGRERWPGLNHKQTKAETWQ